MTKHSSDFQLPRLLRAASTLDQALSVVCDQHYYELVSYGPGRSLTVSRDHDTKRFSVIPHHISGFRISRIPNH